VPRPEAKAIFDRLVTALVATDPRDHRDHPQRRHQPLPRDLHRHRAGPGLDRLWSGSGLSAPTRELLPVAPVIAVGWVMLIVATVSVVTMHHHRFRALVLIGIIGLSISAGFAYLSAPDLALTQISVETVTIMLLLLALHFMPKVTPKESPAGLKLRDAAIALGAGGGRRRAGLRVPDARYRDDLGLPHRQQLRGRRRHERGQRHPRGLPRLRYLRRDHRAGDRGPDDLRADARAAGRTGGAAAEESRLFPGPSARPPPADDGGRHPRPDAHRHRRGSLHLPARPQRARAAASSRASSSPSRS
jgi:uncharacterized MnhB-related membrane protein